MTLTEFLTARYDEREAVARRAYSQGEWRSGSTYGMFVSVEARSWTVVSGEWERSDADHIALNDPAYVLADIAAKREIVELHSGDEPLCGWSQDARTSHDEEPPCDTLRLLALPYTDHPDYDEAWRVA